MKQVIIAGGSGYIGTTLATYLSEHGYQTTIISRTRLDQDGPWKHASWDGRTVGEWAQLLDGAVAVVNLAGRTVDCIKTPDHCDEILRSRVESTLAIGHALREISSPPPVWVQMSTAHIYGDPPHAVCVESSAPGYGLAPIVGKAWEEAYAQSVLPDMRQVILRTSFVLGRHGGALPKMALLVKMGLGGRIGNGTQGISWIHELDMHRLIHRAIEEPSMKGVYVASAPHPVSQVEFMRTLRRTLHIPIGLPATALMVKIGARVLMRTDPELVLYGRYVKSERLDGEGFEFKFKTVMEAFEDIFG